MEVLWVHECKECSFSVQDALNAPRGARKRIVFVLLTTFSGRDGAVIFDTSFEDFRDGDVLIASELKEKSPPPFLYGHHFMQVSE